MAGVPEGDSRVLSRRSYRLVDVATKLAGVSLVAGGLEFGLTTTPGALLGLAGATLATLTVFLDHS